MIWNAPILDIAVTKLGMMPAPAWISLGPIVCVENNKAGMPVDGIHNIPGNASCVTCMTGHYPYKVVKVVGYKSTSKPTTCACIFERKICPF